MKGNSTKNSSVCHEPFSGFNMLSGLGLLQSMISMCKPEILPSGESWSDGEELWDCQSSVGQFSLLILFLCSCGMM